MAKSHMRRAKAPGSAGLAMLALFLGLIVLGADIEMVDSINIAAPGWMAAALVYLSWIAWRGWRSGRKEKAIAALLILSGYAAVALLLFRPLWNAKAATTIEGTELRIVSFNLNKDNDNERPIARWIASQSADYVVLLEAIDAAAPVTRLLKPSYPYQYDCLGNGECSTVILSRTPASKVTHYARGDTENRQTISALTAYFDADGKPLAVTAVHMPRPWPLGDQAARMRELAAIAGADRGNHLLAGDFNNVPWTFAMNRLALDMDVRLLSGAVPTWPTAIGSAAMLPLDNLYGGGCVTPVEADRGPDLGSDHFPLTARLRLEDCDE